MRFGEILTVKEFSFTNKAGGTGLSDWKWNEKFEKPIKVEIVKVFDDYEIGRRGWAVPHPDEKELIAYLDRNAKKGIPSFNRDTNEITYEASDLYILFVGEFAIVENYKEVINVIEEV